MQAPPRQLRLLNRGQHALSANKRASYSTVYPAILAFQRCRLLLTLTPRTL